MRIRDLRRMSREAYTLIELLVVISIIAILISLTAAAVMHVLWKPPEVKVRNDFSQMEGGIQQFMTEYNIEYVPSKLKLCPKYQTYQDPKTGAFLTPLDRESVDFLQKTIGRNSKQFTNTWQSAAGIQWVAGMPANGFEILEGQQVLVFLLGGIITKSGTQYSATGFSTDPAHPDTPSAPGTNRIGPFFQFDANRLSIPPGKQYFPAYQDGFGLRQDGKPRFYAFFSSYGKQNGYNRYRADGSLANGGTATSPVASDCASLGLWPYASTPAVAATATTQATPLMFVKPDGWQIISSGQDGSFGPGTDITAPAASQYYWNRGTAGAIPNGGADDLASFASGKLQFGN
jgi:prepilin-type N-terminal cleavage/methylation domain-containing protein